MDTKKIAKMKFWSKQNKTPKNRDEFLIDTEYENIIFVISKTQQDASQNINFLMRMQLDYGK